jgi:hypothetical protein
MTGQRILWYALNYSAVATLGRLRVSESLFLFCFVGDICGVDYVCSTSLGVDLGYLAWAW